MDEDLAINKGEEAAFLHVHTDNVPTQDIIHKKRSVGRLISCCSRFHNERRWRVLVATMVCQLVATWPFCFAVFYHELLSVYGERHDIVSLVLSVPMGLSHVSGVFVGPLIARFGSRVVVVSGSLIITASFVLGFFANSVLYLILTIGVCGGIGSCMVNLGSNVAIGDHFDKGKDMAYSIGGIGTSVATLMFMPIHAYVIPRYGLNGGLLITCALLLHSLPAGLVLAPIRSRRHHQINTTKGDNKSEDKKTNVNMKVKCRELFMNPLFVLWLCGGVLGSMTVIVFDIVFVDFVVSEGVSETSGALMASLPGFTGIIGRLCFGFISSKITDRKIFLSISVMALCGILLIVIAYVHSEAALYVIACAYGFTMAAVIVSVITTTDHLTKDEHRAEAFGMMATATGAGFIASGPFSGRILDATGSYASVFIWNGSLNLATCAVLAVIVVIINLTLRRQDQVV